MLWADTTAGIMKMRNGANSAWISLWELDGTFIATDISLSAGTAGAPSLYFTGDTNTGIYSPGADQVAISTNSSQRLVVDANGNIGINTASPQNYGAGYTPLTIDASTSPSIELRVAGTRYGRIYASTSALNLDTWAATPMIFGINSAEKMRLTSTGLGIGTSAPAGKAMILGSDTTSFGTITNGALNLGTTNGTTNGRYVNLNFGYDTGATNAPASIGFTYTAQTGNGAGSLQFGTRSVTTDTAPDVRMTITSAGNVGIGTTSPSVKFEVNGDILSAGRGTSFGYKLPDCRVFNPSSGGIFAIDDYTTERLRIDGSGRLLVGTSSAVTGANASISKLNVIGNSSNSAGNAVAVIGRGAAASTLSTGNDVAAIFFTDNGSNEFAAIACQVDAATGAADAPGRLVFSTTADGVNSPTERMRITNGGIVYAGTTSADGDAHVFERNAPGSYAFRVTNSNTNNGVSTNGIKIVYPSVTPNDTNAFLACVDSTNNKATIRNNGGLANYSANNVNLSDINTKKDISPAAGAWECLKEWEIVNFRYKDQSDDADLNLGVIAQQVAESCPEVITIFQEAKEATEDAPAQEERLGVKEQQMYWMAIKALQEAQVRIEQLEAKVAALESA
jgi:hypothetical protein